jgi:hypothetical protein
MIDIPYIAGYSEDGKTVFIDRHLPRSFRWLLKTVRVEPFLLTHEIVEKALLDELRLHYLHAHHRSGTLFQTSRNVLGAGIVCRPHHWEPKLRTTAAAADREKLVEPCLWKKLSGPASLDAPRLIG